MFSNAPNPPRIDLAIISHDRLLQAGLPVPAGEFKLDVALEFALASNYWQFGSGGPKQARDKIQRDIDKVAQY